VPEVGFEPTRPFEQSILSAPRLPFRHSGFATRQLYQSLAWAHGRSFR